MQRSILLVTILSCFFSAGSSAGNYFIENKGQFRDRDGNARPEILFYTQNNGLLICLEKNSLSIVYHSGPVSDSVKVISRMDIALSPGDDAVTIYGEGKLSSYDNFYLPSCPGGIIHVHEFARVKYENFYPGTDLVFSFSEKGKFIYNFIDRATGRENNSGNEPFSSSCDLWSTYCGGNGSDQCAGITIDAENNSYTTGYTQSPDFPVTVGSFQQNPSGQYDAFVIKLDSCGSREWCTYLGSSTNDFGSRIKMCDTNIVTCGYTSGTNFPVSTNAWQTVNNGSYDTYIFKMTPSGTRIWCTYFGSTGGELGTDLAVDSRFNIYAGGSTSSASLPIGSNPFQSSNAGAQDAFLVKFDSSGIRKWGTFYGGSGSEDVHALTVDANDNVIFTGGTFSNDLNLSSNPFQGGNMGAQDIYVCKFDSAGARIFSTYSGGSGSEDAFGLCTDASGSIYVSGFTSSTDYPVTFGIRHAGDYIHITKFNSTGSLAWATYVGGSGNEVLYSMAADGNGHFYALLSTSSNDMPIVGTPIQASNNGMTDLYILKFSAAGSPLWSTYYGGTQDDFGYDIAAAPDMSLFLCGLAYSTDLPVVNPFQPVNGGSEDGFIGRFPGNFDITVGENENENESFSSVYPNPAADFIEVPVAPGQVKIVIYNLSGQVLYSEEFNGQLKDKMKIPVKELANGLYFIRISDGTGSSTKKIVIRK